MPGFFRALAAFPGRLAVGTVRWVYQNGIGRLLPKVCIYEPSCSNYMIQAIQTHGLLKGVALGSWRICRCHPFAQGGWDPVPGREYSAEELAMYREKCEGLAGPRPPFTGEIPDT